MNILNATSRSDKPRVVMNTLSKDVEKVFTKICQSLELYEVNNIPIITEFLEF